MLGSTHQFSGHFLRNLRHPTADTGDQIRRANNVIGMGAVAWHFVLPVFVDRTFTAHRVSVPLPEDCSRRYDWDSSNYLGVVGVVQHQCDARQRANGL